MNYNKEKMRKSDLEWWRVWRFKQELDICGDYDDDNEPCISHAYNGVHQIDRAEPEEDDISTVIVKKYDRNGNLIEERLEVHNYTQEKVEREKQKDNG